MKPYIVTNPEIEEMAKVIAGTEKIARDAHCGLPSPRMYATDLYRKGYKKQAEVKTLYDHIKAMTLDEMIAFFMEIESASVITAADRYICNKCRKEHNNHCPMVDDKCLYDLSDRETIKMWLLGEADEMKGAIK